MRRYEHSELEGADVGTTFHNDTIEGEVLLSHKRAGRLVGSFGGWFLTRAFDAIGEEALSPPVDQQAFAGFLYEEIESPHATVQFGGRLDHAKYQPEGGLRARDFNEFSGSIGLLLKPQAANDNLVFALNVARASRYPALEELYYFGPHPGNLAFEIGNEDLEAEHALGFDVSVRGRGSRFEGELTFFRNDISNYIFREPTGEIEEDFPVVENVAADSMLTGFEAHADLRLTSDLIAEVTYDRVRGELQGLGRSAAAYSAAAGPLRAARISEMHSRSAAARRSYRIRIACSARRLPTDGYTTARFFASYSFNAGGVLNTITARLDNATDKLYRNHLNYLKDVLPEIGRSFKVVYSLGF